MDKVLEVRDRAVCDGCHEERVGEERGPDQGLDEERKVGSCTLMTHRGKKKRIGRAEGTF